MSSEPTISRLRDIGQFLALVWAGCSTLYLAGLTSLVLGMNPGVPAVPFFFSCAGLPMCIVWVATFFAWRWPTVGGLALIAGGVSHLLVVSTMVPGMCSPLRALLGLLALAGAILLLAARPTAGQDVHG
jgi:hypothetical protein